jgi:hypothetical protein
MVQINFARLQTGFTVISYCTDLIGNIRWATLPILGDARLSTGAAQTVGAAELKILTRLQPGAPGGP